MDEFFEVCDANGTYGLFQNEKLALECAAYYEQSNYSDEPDEIHIYVYSRSFDDSYWMEEGQNKIKDNE